MLSVKESNEKRVPVVIIAVVTVVIDYVINQKQSVIRFASI